MSEGISVNFKTLDVDYQQDYVATLPLALFNQLKNCLTACIKLGGLEIKITALPNFTTNTIELTPQLMTALDFSEDTTCHCAIEGDLIRLGPVIAIFSSNGSIRRAHEETANFRLQATVEANAIAKTILYFFGIKDVDFINQRINGTYFNEKTNLWEKKPFPFPDVFYDRGGGVLKNQIPISNFIRQQFNQNTYKRVNAQHYFDKWDVHKNLLNYPKIAKHLPHTVLYQDVNDLETMLQQTSIIYIKDCYGSNGRGVMRVIKLPNYGFEYSYSSEDTVVRERVDTLKELVSAVDSFFKKKKTILQRAINLIKINSSHVDLRATVQRNSRGDLEIVAYPVRVGKSKSPITSTKSGSSVFTFEDFFQSYFNYNEEEVCQLMEEVDLFLTEVYFAIEDVYGTFGEIGIDFAIDMEGLIWFIECNAKPGKDTLYFSHGKEIVERAFLNPLEYARYISGFSHDE